MNTYPLVFSCRQLVEGDAFAAGVEIKGRALLEQDGDEWTVCGVEPGGFAGCGNSPGEAYADFRNTLATILFDAALFFPSNFEAFEREVRDFAGTRDDEAARLWEAARAEVQKGTLVTEPFAAKLPRNTKSAELTLTITRLDESRGLAAPATARNQVDQVCLQEAA